MILFKFGPWSLQSNVLLLSYSPVNVKAILGEHQLFY